MKLQIFVLFVVLGLLSFGSAADPPAASSEPGKKVPPEPFTHTNGDQVLEQLQGGSPDLFIVIFYVNQAKAAEVQKDIQDKIVAKDFPWARVTTVDLTKVQDYYKLFRVVNLEGEPKRGHTEPQVLVMRKGEGIVIRGPKIADGILKRISRVQDGSIFGQSGNGADTDSYSFRG